MPDFAHFGTEAMTPTAAAPKLPTLPQRQQRRPTIAAPPNHPQATIDDEMPSQKLDKPALQEHAPPAGDEDLVISPEDDRYQMPSTPYQNTPGDDSKDWPQPASLSPQGGGSLNSRASPAPPAAVRAAIEKVAAETGVSPAYLLATAERESSFNPNSGGSGSIAGLYQATGGLRKKYGIEGDAEGQTRGYVGFLKDLRRDMGQRMNRAPTDAETYLGHHFGASRGAGIASGQIAPDTPVSDVFTPNELRLNPHIVKAGTVGRLKDDTIADMERRMGGYSSKPGEKIDTSKTGTDFAQFGQSAEPGIDPNLPPLDQDATKLAQIPGMMKNIYQPDSKVWGDAVASMPVSKNIDDRRGNTRPSDRVREGFSALRQPTGEQTAARQNFAQFGEPVSPYVAPGPTDVHQGAQGYNTKLEPLDEMSFRQWVKDKGVPFNPEAASSDYDMRGYYRALQQGDPRAVPAGTNPNDGQMHYPDTWKTPTHKTFSAESQYADPNGPQWTGDDKLVSPGGRILRDERSTGRPSTTEDFAGFGTPAGQ